MSNKEKNTKEEPYLLQDSELDELEKKTITTYDDRDQESKPEDVSKAIQKAKPEDVTYGEDGSISVKEENNLKEVEKSQILKYDIKKSSDVKALQQMLDNEHVLKLARDLLQCALQI